MILLYPWWLLPAAMLIIAWFMLTTARRDDWQRVIPDPVFRFLNDRASRSKSRHPALLVAAVICTALSSPAIETRDQESYKHAQGWIVIADVSRSMTLSDITPTRLAAMRNTAIDLAEHASASSTTLIVFAGDAFIVSPPSFDNQYFNSNVSLLEHGIIPIEGSNLTRAISLALAVIEGSHLINARLFVLSDTGGFNNRSDAAIARLASLGHRTDIILFGSGSEQTTAPYDLSLAKVLADSGNGRLLHANAIGQVDLAPLDLHTNVSDSDYLTLTGLTSIRWRNQSHWLLLLVIPLILWLIQREKLS